MNNDQEITQANTVRSRRSCRWINVKQKKNSGVLSLRGITGFHGCSRLSLLASIGPLDWGFSSPAPIYSFIVYSLYVVASLFWNILKPKKNKGHNKKWGKRVSERNQWRRIKQQQRRCLDSKGYVFFAGAVLAREIVIVMLPLTSAKNWCRSILFFSVVNFP